jgi:hypothetical protein
MRLDEPLNGVSADLACRRSAACCRANFGDTGHPGHTTGLDIFAGRLVTGPTSTDWRTIKNMCAAIERE